MTTHPTETKPNKQRKSFSKDLEDQKCLYFIEVFPKIILREALSDACCKLLMRAHKAHSHSIVLVRVQLLHFSYVTFHFYSPFRMLFWFLIIN